MKIGTILFNTGVRENHPYRYSIYTGQSNGNAGFIYPYADGINNGHYLISDIGEDKPIKPVGIVNLADIIKKEIENAINN